MIELSNISKRYGKVSALQGVCLTAEAGSIHGIVGENGAGKSTLMKILTGFTARTEGDILAEGRKVRLDTPSDAMGLGIGMLYQEPLDFPQLTVLDNFLAGRKTAFAPEQARPELARLAAAFGFAFDPGRRVEQLTVGERQQLELLRLIHGGVRLLILDEPTTGISERQQEQLFAALRTLQEEGTAILLVSHKLEEVESLCDAVTILRHGRVAASMRRPFDRQSLLQAMFDNLPETKAPPRAHAGGYAVIEFEQVSSTAGRAGLKEVSTSVRAGEVVGLAGVDGSGQAVFLKIAGGLLPPESGRVRRFGRPLADGCDRSEAVFLPADRLAEGLLPGMTIRDHHLLASPGDRLLSAATGLAGAWRAIERFNIKGHPGTAVEELSGGNQQRLLLSLIPEDVRLILMENPTRGLDIQSAAWTWQELHRRKGRDGAIIFASPDLEEILAQATRVVVFFDGRIVLDTPAAAATYHDVSRAITASEDR